MDHEQLKELLALHALGLLEGEEARAVAAHLAARCDECEAELRAYDEALAAMAVATAEEGGADRIWPKLEQRLAESASQPPTAERDAARRGAPAPALRAARQSARPWKIIFAATAAAAIVLAMLNIRYVGALRDQQSESASRLNDLASRVSMLQQNLEASRRQAASLHEQLDLSDKLTEAALAPDARTIRLASQPAAPNASGQVVISSARGSAVLEVKGLPVPPSDKVYELWWIGSRSGPVRAAVFRPSAQGTATVTSPIPPAGERLLASAVTLEAAPGGDKPLGAMYLKGAPGASQ